MKKINNITLAILLLISYAYGIHLPLSNEEYSLFNAFWSIVFVIMIFLILKHITHENN